MTALAACRTCGTEPLENARFCHGCGSPVQDGDIGAESKRVTVLFADVVQNIARAWHHNHALRFRFARFPTQSEEANCCDHRLCDSGRENQGCIVDGSNGQDAGASEEV